MQQQRRVAPHLAIGAAHLALDDANAIPELAVNH